MFVVLLGALVYGVALVLAIAAIAPTRTAEAQSLSQKERLGKELFFDTNLSDPIGQSCASCHAPDVGWTGPDAFINIAGGVYEGAVPGRFGNRKPPASAYAGDSPILYYDQENEVWVGGMFWDGRATGATLGDPLAEQAQGPFLNPLEQNMASPQAVCEKVKVSSYAKLFEQVWGKGSLNCDAAQVGLTYERIARSIAAYERSSQVSAFTSKFDYYLKGKAKLTAQEKLGLELFNGKAQCASCHISEPGPQGQPPLFTDFTYDNLGIPRNPVNPFYYEPEWNPLGASWVDEGLGGYLKAAEYEENIYQGEMGKFKVPTLRNVDQRPSPGFVKAYGHNGYFKSLEEIVHFYNTRDVFGAKWIGVPWPAPEVAENVNTTELGNLGLTPREEAALVAFMRTLNDGYKPGGK
jgi:cytochrome c peroxidase